MYFRTDDWHCLPDGRRYLGALSGELPNGLGIITLEDTNHFYAGEFVNGKRHGRGFLLTYLHWTTVESVWERGSYEEVMATAQFDSCGRVIHVDNVGRYVKQKVEHDKWEKTQDGYWENDVFVKEIQLNKLHQSPWNGCATIHTAAHTYLDILGSKSTYFNDIDKAGPDGHYSFNLPAYVTIYDDDHLLFLECYGRVFILGIDDQFTYRLYHHGYLEAEYTFTLLKGSACELESYR